MFLRVNIKICKSCPKLHWNVLQRGDWILHWARWKIFLKLPEAEFHFDFHTSDALNLSSASLFASKLSSLLKVLNRQQIDYKHPQNVKCCPVSFFMWDYCRYQQDCCSYLTEIFPITRVDMMPWTILTTCHVLSWWQVNVIFKSS